ncbi:MAG: hypothetical protein LBM95_06660 [Lactobacillales bacterium]|nr:hypothetical protein [Lactobacillales bacterium]
MYTTAPRIDCLVIGALDGIELLQQRKERLKIKQRYFRCFLSGLSTTEVNQLKQCLKATSDDLGVFERALDEIYEIETAIALRYGYEVPAERIAFEVTDNPLDNLESILLALEV